MPSFYGFLTIIQLSASSRWIDVAGLGFSKTGLRLMKELAAEMDKLSWKRALHQ